MSGSPGGTSRSGPALALFLAAVHVALAVSASIDRSATADETDYLGAGRWFLETGEWRTTAASFHPPLSYYLNSLLLPALPDRVREIGPDPRTGAVAYDRRVGEEILYRSGRVPAEILLRARLPLAAASGLLVLLVWAWAHEWLGRRSAALAATIVAFDPNLLAHAGVVATDSLLAVTYFAGAYAWWRFARRPTAARLVVFGLALALAMLSKFPGLLLAPAAGLLLAGRLVLDRGFAFPARLRAAGRLRRVTVGLALAASIVAPSAGLLSWAGYLFSTGRIVEAGVPHRTIDRLVPEALGLRSAAYSLAEAPWPAPAYVGCVQNLIGHSAAGHHAWFLGRTSLFGWRSYFPVTLAVKEPLAALALLAAGLLALGGARELGPGRPEAMLPPALALAAAIASPIAIGVRHVLHVVPFLALFAGAALAGSRGESKLRRSAAWLAATLVVLATALDYPFFLASFNVLGGGPRGGHRILSDSNVDWGQDLDHLADTQRHLGAGRLSGDLFYFVPEGVGPKLVRPEGANLFALGVTARHGQYDRARPDRYAGYDPEDALLRAGHSIEIYDRLPEE